MSLPSKISHLYKMFSSKCLQCSLDSEGGSANGILEIDGRDAKAGKKFRQYQMISFDKRIPVE